VSYHLLRLITGSIHSRAQGLQKERPLLAIGSEALRPKLGTGPKPHAAGEVDCCPSRCQGQACSTARALIRNLATELVSLDSSVRLLAQSDYSSSSTEASPPLRCFANSSALLVYKRGAPLTRNAAACIRRHRHQRRLEMDT
jgi:hypothetical protein